MGRTIEELVLAAKTKHSLNERFIREIETLIDLGVVTHTGGNIWNVDGYEVNQMTRTCTCPANYEVKEKVGKMCQHVFAMHIMRMHADDNPMQRIGVDEILKKGVSEVWIDWDYATGIREVMGYVVGRERVRLKSNERFVITFERFSESLHRNGYMLSDLPKKMEGSLEDIHQWFVGRSRSGLVFTKSVWELKSVTTAMIEAKNRKDAMRRFEIETGG